MCTTDKQTNPVAQNPNQFSGGSYIGLHRNDSVDKNGNSQTPRKSDPDPILNDGHIACGGTD
jgi:hypothetical protein